MSSVFGAKLKQPSRRPVYARARAWHTPSVPDPVCPPATRRCHSPPHSHPARGLTGASLHPVKKHRVADYAAWPPLGPQPQHRSLFLCSSTPATDRSASPLSLPPLAAGKGHLRLGGGATHGTLGSVASSRGLHTRGGSPGLAVLGFSVPFLLLSIHRDKQTAVAVFGPALGFPVHSLFILSFPRVLPETFPHAHQSAPGEPVVSSFGLIYLLPLYL